MKTNENRSGISRLTCLLLSITSLLTAPGCSAQETDRVANAITISSLLDEMVSADVEPLFPDPFYSASMLSSYDRRSVIPGTPSWHANDDGGGFIRYEANNGRVEKVLFDQEGPGAITRIITTGGAHGANLRFYFDGESEASITIPSFDISAIPLEIPAGLMYKHEHYPTRQGISFYYPMPYAKRCKITVDNPDRGYVYHVNYRQYRPGTKVRTFTLQEAESLAFKAVETGYMLLNPTDFDGGAVTTSGDMAEGSRLSLELPAGRKAVRTLHFDISGYDDAEYGRLMRGLIVKITFDGTQTVSAPLSDFAGAGMGAPEVKSYYLTSNGKGKVSIRFVMPYKKNATVSLENITPCTARAEVAAHVSDWKWTPNTLYFHAAWRQQNGLHTNEGIDYVMATLSGRGVMRGDVLSLYNYSPRWYGEGDEHIWVDEEDFPSHFGCGTEDYYNSTYAPIHPYHTPWGGAPREDDEASRGYNTFLRTRNLDGIPFNRHLKFEFELLSWDGGNVDYSSTVYWYGDADSRSLDASPDRDALYELPPAIYTGEPNRH